MKRSVRTKSAVPTATSDSQRPPRIFLLEDHPVMRLGLKMILTERGFEVCGEAERPDQAIPIFAAVGAGKRHFGTSWPKCRNRGTVMSGPFRPP